MTTLTTGKATEFITFTRASNATVTDSDGKVKWAPHNLLTNSESFDAASWMKSFLSVAANSTTAPNGTTTADKLYPTSSSGRLYQTVTVPEYSVLSFYAKAAEMTALNVRDPANNSIAIVYVDLNTGAISGSAAANASAVSAEDGWWFITWATAGVAYANVSIAPCNAVGSTASTPSGTNGIYLWGAALYRSDLGGMQPNTSAYPMYNPTTPKNLLGYTEDFSNAAWGSFNTTETINQLTLTSTSGGATQSKTLVSGGVYTLQCKIKKGTNNFAYLNVQGSSVYASAVFDLVNGVTGETKVSGAGFAVSSHTISTADADGYFTCRATFTVGAASVVVIGFAPAATGNTFDAFGNPTGCTSGNTLFVKQAQLSDSASLDPYVPVYGAAVTSAAYYGPRRDFDPVTLACKGLLVEEQRTNLQVNSNDLSSWPAATPRVTITSNDTTSPEGMVTGSKVLTNSASAFGSYVGRGTGISTSSGAFCISAYFKKGTSNGWVAVYASDGTNAYTAWFNITSGVKGTTSTVGTGFTALNYDIVNAGGGWYRCWISITRATTTQLATYFFVDCQADSSLQSTLNNFDYLYGAQLEAGSFATSYIPTGAATATRLADVASVSTQAFPYSATEGTIVVNASSPCIAAIANMITLDNGTTQERIRLLTDVASVKTIVTESNTTQANLSPGSAIANIPFKFAVAYKVNDFAAVVNGSAAAADAAGNVPVVNIARLGADSSGNYLNGHIRQITYLPRRISNAELQTRTA